MQMPSMELAVILKYIGNFEILASVLIAIVLIMWQLRKKSSDATCGSCGYSIKGIKSDRCPECGGHYWRVGTTKEQAGRGMGIIGRIVLWTCALGFVGSITTGIVKDYAPAFVTRHVDWGFVLPKFGVYKAIDIDYVEQTDMEGQSEKTFTLKLLYKENTKRTLAHVDLDDLTIWFDDEIETESRRQLSAQVIEDWMKIIISEGSNADCKIESARIMGLIVRVSNGDLSNAGAGTGFSSWRYGDNSSSLTPYSALSKWTFYFIWLVGIVILIYKRYKASDQLGKRIV